MCRARAHETRVRVWTDPHQARASRGEKHPVYDFLFAYYSFRPAWLRRLQPGAGVALGGEAARAFLADPAYHETPYGVALDPDCESVPNAPHRVEFPTQFPGQSPAGRLARLQDRGHQRRSQGRQPCHGRGPPEIPGRR